MNKIWEFLIDICIIIIIAFVSVAVYFSLRTETVIKSFSDDITHKFINDVSKNGILTVNQYENYMEQLSFTNAQYDILLSHSHTVIEPEYRLRTAEEIIIAQDAAYTGPNLYTYREVITNILEVNDPINNANLNSETNESVLSSAANSPANPSHVHSDSCYNGTKHTHSGSSSSGGGCYGSYTSGQCGKSISFSYIQTTTGGYRCPNDGNYVTINGVMGYYNCSNGHTNSYTLYWYRECSVCGDKYTFNYPSSTYNGLSCSYSSSSYSLNCGKTEGTYYYGNTQVYPICSKLVTSISSTHPVQTIAVGDSLITTVIANYMDGSKKVVVATTTFSPNSICINQSVTLSYSYSIEGISYPEKTCTATVTIIPRTKICIRGHTYNLNSNGTDPGCPYCRSWVDHLSFIYPTTGSMTIPIGTSLQDNGVNVLVTYYDGRTEILTSGYADNLDSHYLGTMQVKVGYKGKTNLLSVTTIRVKILCDICGREYQLYPDGTNPGCPYCISKVPVFTGNVLKYDETEYTESILNKLFENGSYKFNKSDEFMLVIESKSETVGRNILDRIYPSMSNRWVRTRFREKIRSD